MKDFNSEEINSIISEKEINIDQFSKNELLEMLSTMILIRNAEYKIAEGRKSGLVGGPVHLGIGQEAIPVGISKYLTNKDKIFGGHRSHSHIISLGIDLKSFFAEILAKWPFTKISGIKFVQIASWSGVAHSTTPIIKKFHK